MLKQFGKEYEASVAKGNVGGDDIAKSAAAFQQGTLNLVLNPRFNNDHSVSKSVEIYCVEDNTDEESRNDVEETEAPVQEEAIYLGRPRIGHGVSENLETVPREVFLLKGDIVENTVEVGQSQDVLQCVIDRTTKGLQVREFSDPCTVGEHDYVRELAGESSLNSNCTVGKQSETGGIVVKKIVLPVRELPSRRRTVWPQLNSDSPKNAPAKKCRLSTRGSMSSDSSGSGNPSVLRTLLQASRKQLKLYQSHNHSSERLKLSLSSMSTSKAYGVTARKVRKKDFGCQADIASDVLQAAQGADTCPDVDNQQDEQLPSAIDQRALLSSAVDLREQLSSAVDGREQLLDAVDSRSQIKALLMGQSYERLPQSDSQGMAWDGRSPAKKQCYDQRYMRVQEHELPGFLCDVVDVVAEYKDLSYSVQSSHNKTRSIEVRRKGLYGIPYPGMTPAQVMIEEAGTAHFFTLVKLVFSVMCKDEDGQLTPDPLLQLLQKLSIKGGHVFCPGVESELALVAPNTKNLMVIELLEPRYQAHDCPVWHMLGTNQSWFPLNEGVHKCKACKGLERYLRTLGKAKERKEIVSFS